MTKYPNIALSEVADFINGFAFKPSDWHNEGEKIIRIQNLTDPTKPFNTTQTEVPEKYRVNPGDVLISWSATLDVFEWSDKPAWLNQHIFKVVPDYRKIDKSYFKYAVKQIIVKMMRYTHGSTMKHINRGEFLESEIPLPSVPEQKRIAAILDKTDALRQKRKQSLKLLDDFIRSVFLDMFGDPVNNSMKWPQKELFEVCAKITDGTHHSPPQESQGIPYITAKHLKPYGLDFESSPTYVSETEHKKIYSRCDPQMGDVLYIKDGVTTGISAVNKYDFEFSMLSSLALLRPDTGLLNSYYLSSWLNNESVKNQIIKNMSGAAIRRLTLSKIKEITINVPPIEIQNNYERIVIKVEMAKTQMDTQYKELDNQFNSLVQRAFRGEL